jgi:hypothetical protein
MGKAACHGGDLLPIAYEGANPNPEWLTPTPVFDWPLLIDIDNPNRFAPWDRRIGGIMKR